MPCTSVIKLGSAAWGYSPNKVKAPAQLSLSSASYPPPLRNDIELDVQDEFERDRVGRASPWFLMGSGIISPSLRELDPLMVYQGLMMYNVRRPGLAESAGSRRGTGQNCNQLESTFLSLIVTSSLMDGDDDIIAQNA